MNTNITIPTNITITFIPVAAVPTWVRDEMIRAVARAVTAWGYTQG